MNDPINDVDFSAGPAAHVAALPQLTSRDIEAAARSVVTAAAEARAREFTATGIVACNGIADPRPAWIDEVTGMCWVSIADGSTAFIVTSHPTLSQDGVCRDYGNSDPSQPEETQFEWILERFTYFHERWPSFPQTMGQHTDSAKAAIQSGQMTAIKPVADAVDRWTGKSQQHFKEYFLDPFLVNTLTNQQALLDELAVAMYAYEGILKQGRVDVKAIADQTVEALDSLSVGSGTDFTAVLGVVGIAFAVVTTVATAGTTTALTLGLIGAGLSAVQHVAAHQEVAGTTTEEVVDSLAEALDGLRQAMDAEEASIAEAVTKTTGEVQGYLSAATPADIATFLPNEPNEDGVTNLTDGEVPDHDEFHLHGQG